ncbi:MAG: glycosyltransferase family 2 protein [Bacteroidetes bacterium]|jgi:GT2 family glycosyltransferase|nr:glycosyltransferase family 2 protein [Bacteroidota bacterium]
MKLSIVIVNYNVEHFLEQCLYSVRKAVKDMEAEIFVVDNNSVDGSLRMLREKFPEVVLIDNKENLGFSKANNQAIRRSEGEYVLLLNPDTVVEDDTFTKVISFMDSHPEAGGLGVKMVDGKGNFLPESKRGLPTPATAFYKIFGFASLFPRSKRFSKYHLGYLDKNQIHEVDVLAGAFMLMRKAVLDKTGLLDEAFFMYGEDIDLSYRITKAGYKNYYFPETRIIHYKGESTKKSSINYVFVFYNAMIIFARKHFSQKRASTFTFLINIAVYFRAAIAIMARFIKQAVLPGFDALLGFAGLFAIKQYWGEFTIYREGGDYPLVLVTVVLPAYLLIWLLSVFFSGGYDKPYQIPKALRGLGIGTLLILVLYALLPENLRFSRALILLGAVWLGAVFSLNRFVGYMLKADGYSFGGDIKKRFLVIGHAEEAIRVDSLLKSTAIKPEFIGLVETASEFPLPDEFIGHIHQVPEMIQIYRINEVIFCSKDIPHQLIIDKMVAWHAAGVDYKIAPEDSLSIIGSNSINTRGDLYTIGINAIDSRANRRSKRLFDVSAALISLLAWPVILWFVNAPFGFFVNALSVLSGRKSWVGYCGNFEEAGQRLPAIRSGVLCPGSAFKKSPENDEIIRRINLFYARDYKVWKDVALFFRSFRKLGN